MQCLQISGKDDCYIAWSEMVMIQDPHTIIYMKVTSSWRSQFFCRYLYERGC